MKTQNSFSDIPQKFLAHFGTSVTGMICGFDRLRFMGTILTLQSVRGLQGFLNRKNVLLKEFKAYAEDLTGRVRAHGQAFAAAAGLAVEYLRSSTQRKEELVEQAALNRGVKEGLIGVFSCTEPCLTYFLRKDSALKHLVLEFGQGKCLHHYFYFLHPEYGLMHLRLQTWFPFGVTVCINGRRWLANLMRAHGIGFVQKRNCFVEIEDPVAAQQLAYKQLEADWPVMLDGLLSTCHPLADELCEPIGQRYYWSLKESEYATDLIFKSHQQLQALYPRFLRHGMEHFGSQDILRFLGKNVPAQGVHGNFEAELNSTLKRRPEGVRIKHYAAGNSIKLYDKEGSVLRVETTINHPEVFRVYRPGQKHPEQGCRWRVLRKGVADTYRRAELCHAANNRYLEALSATSTNRSTGEVADAIFRSITKNGRRYRALNPWTPQDASIFECISNGDWLINGFRNRDIRQHLFGSCQTVEQKRRTGAKVTRILALLRAHGIVKKVTGTHRYLLTSRGHQIVAALQTARKTSVEDLCKLAA